MFDDCIMAAHSPTQSRSLLTKLVILLLCASHLCVSAESCYVIHTVDTTCPDEEAHCMTLSEYGKTFNGNFTSKTKLNLTLILLPGTHTLDNNLTITNLTSLVILGNGTDDRETRVSCGVDVSFNFHDIDKIQLTGIIFSGCMSTVTVTSTLFLDKCKLEGDITGSRLELNEVNFVKMYDNSFIMNRHDNNSLRLGGVVFIVQSNVSIYHCLFVGNYAIYGSSLYALQSTVKVIDSRFSNNTSVYHGGAIEIDQRTNITINNCTFTENSIEQSEEGSDIPFIGGGGISVLRGSRITVSDSVFINNLANISNTAGGAIFAGVNSTVTISNSEFVENIAGNSGGAVAVYDCKAFISNTMILNSTSATAVEGTTDADRAAGAIAALNSSISIDYCTFMNNVAETNGGGAAIGYAFGFANVSNSIFVNNVASLGAAAIASIQYSFCRILNCTFNGNIALQTDGGAVTCENCNLILENSTFDNNSALGSQSGSGGGMNILCSIFNSTGNCGGTITNCLFTRNSALIGGSAIVVQSVPILYINGSNTFKHNNLSTSVFHAVDSEVFFDGNTTFSENIGSIFAYNSNLTFSGSLTISNVSSSDNPNIRIEPGGALMCFISNIILNCATVFSDNNASYGAGILALQCTVYVTGELNITNNVASRSGGGIYASRSEVNFAGVTNISNNRARENGGGIDAVNTIVILSKGTLSLIQNNATQRGGGMYLESSSKLYLTKVIPECDVDPLCFLEPDDRLSLQFIDNSADYGGAICVDDYTTPLTCSVTQSQGQSAVTDDCFFQTLVLYPTSTIRLEDLEKFYGQLNFLNTHFTNNSARISVDSVYGGLLDRCGVSPLAEVNLPFLVAQPRYIDAVKYLNVTTNLSVRDISSDPVRVCFCNNGMPDCSYKPPPRKVRKGESFTAALVAVDHVNHTVPSRILSNTASSSANLQRGQGRQRSSIVCTELNYNVIAPTNTTSASISVFADGPCTNDGISNAMIQVQFLSCPIGFIESPEACDCDPILVQNGYIEENCSIDSQSVLRRDGAWIGLQNISNQEEYLASRSCPLDYCLSSSSEKVFVNLNIPNGADASCAFHRSGILCGHCANGFSLLLGTAHCGECSNNGLGLLIFFAVAGVLCFVISVSNLLYI